MVCDECLDVLSLLDRNDHDDDDDDDDDSSLSEGFLAPKHRSDAEPVTPILVSKNPNKVRDSKTETHRGISDGMVVVWYGGTTYVPPQQCNTNTPALYVDAAQGSDWLLWTFYVENREMANQSDDPM